MKKEGRPNYLSQYKKSLIFALYYIECVNGILLDSHVISDKFQLILKAIKYWSGNDDINKKPPLNYFPKLIKRVNERENEHETQARKLRMGLVKI